MDSEKSNNSELNQNEIAKSVTNRKIYNRDDFFRINRCTAEIPDYLKDFQFLYNNFYEENWCCKPFPKFSEVIKIPEGKGKSVYINSKLKGRQRTLSNQSGENTGEYHENFNRQRSYAGNGKFNRYGSIQNETDSIEDIKFDNNKFINLNDFEDNPEGQWLKVETRPNRSFNASKPYSQNIQVPENHWKKWTKDSTSATDKINRPQNIPFNRSDKSNSIWLRKTENDGRQRNTKYYGRHSVSKSGDQTEDIWQDDWDTEMKSEIARVDDLDLDSFELSKSSILSTTPPIVEPESQPINQIFETPSNLTTPEHELWFYRDLSDMERGPFKSEEMANWLATGYFNPATFVRRKCDERYLLLAEYRSLYGRIPFTAGPTIPSILRNTSIEIDINQLLIGVENNIKPQVIKFATTVPHTPHNNVTRIEENVNISPKNVILEEKRLLDESRAELERERERMLEEQTQWRARVAAELQAEMEAKYTAKMAELLQRTLETNISQSITSPIDQNVVNGELIAEPDQSVIEVNEIIDNVSVNNESDKTVPISIDHVATPVIDKWEIDDTEIPAVMNSADNNNKWFSTKDIKNQKKNKKMKSKEAKNVKEEKQQIVPIPDAKPPAQPTDTKLAILPRESVVNTAPKETVVTAPRVKPIRFEMENRKNEPVATWNASKNAVHSTAHVKSFVDIQAEESEKIKQEKLFIENECNNMSTEVLHTTSANKLLAKSEKGMSVWGTNSQASIVSTKSGLLEEEEGEEAAASKETTKKGKDTQFTESNSEIPRNNDIPKPANLPETNKPIGKSVKIEPSKPAVTQKTNTTKSFLEIQAEETMKQEKQVKELDNESTTIVSSPIKTDTPVSWKKPPLVVNTGLPSAIKSLLEIQAEEALKEKRKKELHTVAKANEIEANRITSFKDSLLKSTKAPQVPVGKSIWDMLPTESPVHKTPVPKPEPQVKQQHVAVKNKSQKETVVSKPENEQDHLTIWCLKKLAKFSDRFELNTVIELLKEVPNEEVMEMALQLLDDSKFTSTFVVEFISKRQEVLDNGIGGDSWQTVKKPVPSPPTATTVSNNSKNKSAKSKSKKKMVVIDTKFR